MKTKTIESKTLLLSRISVVASFLITHSVSHASDDRENHILVQIKSASDQCLHISDGLGGFARDVYQSSCEEWNSKSSSWIIPEHLSGNTYLLHPADDVNVCMDVSWKAPSVNARIRATGCNGGDNQHFELNRLGGNDYVIRIPFSGKCVGIGSPSWSFFYWDRLEILQKRCDRSLNQSFIIPGLH